MARPLLTRRRLNSKNQATYEWRTTKEDPAGVKINFDSMTTLDCIYLYGSSDKAYEPTKLKVTFSNGQISTINVFAEQS